VAEADFFRMTGQDTAVVVAGEVAAARSSGLLPAAREVQLYGLPSTAAASACPPAAHQLPAGCQGQRGGGGRGGGASSQAISANGTSSSSGSASQHACAARGSTEYGGVPWLLPAQPQAFELPAAAEQLLRRLGSPAGDVEGRRVLLCCGQGSALEGAAGALAALLAVRGGARRVVLALVQPPPGEGHAWLAYEQHAAAAAGVLALNVPRVVSERLRTMQLCLAGAGAGEHAARMLDRGLQGAACGGGGGSGHDRTVGGGRGGASAVDHPAEGGGSSGTSAVSHPVEGGDGGGGYDLVVMALPPAGAGGDAEAQVQLCLHACGHQRNRLLTV
jgi:hypothetical protein